MILGADPRAYGIPRGLLSEIHGVVRSAEDVLGRDDGIFESELYLDKRDSITNLTYAFVRELRQSLKETHYSATYDGNV